MFVFLVPDVSLMLRGLPGSWASIRPPLVPQRLGGYGGRRSQFRKNSVGSGLIWNLAKVKVEFPGVRVR